MCLGRGFQEENVLKKMIQIYTGDGKGKTTCSIGLSIRAAAAGLKVCFIQFDKGGEESAPYSERKILRTLPNIDLKPTGNNRRNKNGTFRFDNIPEDFEEAKNALNTLPKRLCRVESMVWLFWMRL